MNTERLELLIQQVRSIPDASARDKALELVQAVMDLHGEALERAMEILSESSAGGKLMEALGEDPAVSAVLLLHDLHPLSLEERVRKALAVSKFHSRGARVELLSIDDGNVRVRVTGAPGLHSAVEAALADAAPDAVEIVVEGEAGFVPVEQLVAAR